ncbi:hypothetical protein [Nocardioides nanhaiensis]|uniref:Terminase n=1 Tax=Nocardioides nanhaiensis TaxID=1476871 RepID=A0ABP8X1V0_9ACTN
MAPLLGSETPRLWTQPLRELTPDTSKGFEVIDFAERFCRIQLMPWQKWWLIHALELLPSGEFRFRILLTLISRQNGKTELLKIVSLWFMYSGRARLVLGVAQNLSIARESWEGALEYIEANPSLAKMHATTRRGAGDYQFLLSNQARYKITAANGKAGRGLTVDLLILDELREQKSEDAWKALSATTAASGGLILPITNAGEQASVVLNSLRDMALTSTDESTGIFEWSAPDGAEITDRAAWAQANPGLGHTITERVLASAAATMSPGAFRTEHLCQRVDTINTALDLQAWQGCADPQLTLDGLRDRVAVCLDVSPNHSHVSLVAAAVGQDGRVRVDVVAAWDSPDAARQALPGLLERVSPRSFGWFPGGPAAALAADLRTVADAREIKSSDVAATCMGFAEQVMSRRLMHRSDPLLNAHAAMAVAMPSGDGWRFARRDSGNVDAVYAAAGAVHLARTLAPSVGKPRIIVAA